MQLKLDTSKTYAIALEGGGAKGAYEIGAWKALEEAGIKYNAVSGTSVGALNGALMAMRDLPRAEAAWNDMRLSKVIELDKEGEEDLHKAMNGELELGDLQELIPQMFEIIRNRGLDVAPLRRMGMSRGRAFSMGVLSGAVEPLFGMLAVIAVSGISRIMPWLLGFSAGAMLYVVVCELIPAADDRRGLFWYVAGFLLMMILDVALG